MNSGGKTRRVCAARVVWAALVAGLALAPVPGAGQGKNAWTLEAVLKQLDRESKSFRSLTANIERTKVTVVVNDRSVEAGQMWLRRDNKFRIELSQPDARTLLRNDDKFYIFNPRIKRVEEYDLGKHKALVDQFMLLGFGSSGDNLKDNYLVTPQGEQMLDQKKVLLLELTPKSPEVRGQISKIHLWIDLSNWLAVQQKFFETGSGDYFTIRYTNVQRNPTIPDSRFRPVWPKDVTRIKPRV